MKRRYATIAAASLAAFVMGAGPTAAQVSTGVTAPNPTSPSVSGAGPSSSSESTDGSMIGTTMGGHTTGSAGTSGSPNVNSNVNENRNTNVNDTTNVNQSPAASPRTGDDDTTKHDRMKQDDQGKKTGLDRADEAAAQHGQHGRDNARERGTR